MTSLKDILKAQEEESSDRLFGILEDYRQDYIKKPDVLTTQWFVDEIKAWHNKAIFEALDAIIEEVIGDDYEEIKIGTASISGDAVKYTKQTMRARYTTLKKELKSQ